MTLRLATWNINSVRLRLPLVAKFVAEHAPDVLCLQETKVEDALFPLAELQALGFAHIAFRGQKSYNGVAILSKLPLNNVASEETLRFDGERHIAATLPGGVRLHNCYVPAGGDIPNPTANPKFAAKLDYMARLTAHMGTHTPADKLILVGDLNIAPLEHDVWSHKQLLDVVSHTPVETEAMGRLQATLNWVDSARHFTPPSEKLYSWWSYRNRDWRASNRGRRLDHIWVTPPLAPTLKACHTFKDWRDSDSPSDHVPVMIEIMTER